MPLIMVDADVNAAGSCRQEGRPHGKQGDERKQNTGGMAESHNGFSNLVSFGLREKKTQFCVRRQPGIFRCQPAQFSKKRRTHTLPEAPASGPARGEILAQRAGSETGAPTLPAESGTVRGGFQKTI